MNEIHPFRMGQCQVGLVGNPKGYVLIDAGFPGTLASFLKALKRLGAAPKDVRAIVITHVHYDHLGCLASILALSGADVLVHAAEAEVLKTGSTPLPCGTNPLARAIVSAFGGFAPKEHPERGVVPTIIVEGEFDLSCFGVQGKIIPTPGHTAGSVSVILDSGDAFVGDAATNMPGLNRRSVFPPFADDPAALFLSWEKLLETGAETFRPAHGAPFDRKKLVASRDGFPWARITNRSSCREDGSKPNSGETFQ